MTTKAPWTDEQVAKLNEFQTCGVMHPFTCPHHRDRDHDGNYDYLVATRDGWICPYCDYKQDWAHDHMLLGALPRLTFPKTEADWRAQPGPWAHLTKEQTDELIAACVAVEKKRIKELEEALDDLFMFAVEGPTSAWMMIPRTEWDQIVARANLKPSRGETMNG